MRNYGSVRVTGLKTDGDDVAEHIKFWAKKEPWVYSRFIFNKYTYYFLQSIILILVAGSFFFFPPLRLLLAFVLAYPLGHLMFCMGHTIVHARYIESPLEDWQPGIVVAWLHHYDQPGAIQKYWWVHRLNFLLQTQSSLIALVGVWILPYLLFGNSIIPLYIMYLFWFSMVEPVHEFAHTPDEILVPRTQENKAERKAARKAHFSLPMYYWLSFACALRLVDEEGHDEHHNHGATNKDLKRIRHFSDLEVPFADWLFDRVWLVALKIKDWGWFKTTPIRKALYLQGFFLVPFAFLLCSLLYCGGWVL
ncbi:hypothetical protein CMI37_17985 [Candidatus Pacearchaeota archaeon]|nr:hypothetical protein [Candidatus Pacearchaeota archaeon]